MKTYVSLAAAAVTLGMGMLSGCSDSGSPTTLAPANAATTVYVTNEPNGTNSTGQILVYSATSAGVTTPSATLTLPTAFLPYNVATDSTGQIYVSGLLQPTSSASTSQILVYAAGASGAATPLRTITAATGSFTFVIGLAVDGSGNLYVASANNTGVTAGGSIMVFSSTANGAATPTRVISGSNTGLTTNVPLGIGVDGAGNIYTAPYTNGTLSGQIEVFSATANGNVAPTRTISGPNTGLTGTIAYQIAVDSSGNVYVPAVNAAASPTATSILVFNATANGNVAPTRTIAGAATGLYAFAGIAVDAVGNVYTVGSTSAAASFGVEVFSATATGNVAPSAAFTSAAYVDPVIYNVAVH